MQEVDEELEKIVREICPHISSLKERRDRKMDSHIIYVSELYEMLKKAYTLGKEDAMQEEDAIDASMIEQIVKHTKLYIDYEKTVGEVICIKGENR